MLLLIRALDIQIHRRCIRKPRVVVVVVHPILKRSSPRAVTRDRNANSATKGRDFTRLRRDGERRVAARDREKRQTGSPDPNNIHQQDIWSSRGFRFPRIGLLPRCVSCELADCARARAWEAAPRHLATVRADSPGGAWVLRLGENRDNDGNCSSWSVCCELPGKNPREETH